MELSVKEGIKYSKDGTIYGYSKARKILLPSINNDIPHHLKCLHKLRTRLIIENTMIASASTKGDGIDWAIKLPALFKIDLPYYLKYGCSKRQYETLINKVD